MNKELRLYAVEIWHKDGYPVREERVEAHSRKEALKVADALCWKAEYPNRVYLED